MNTHMTRSLAIGAVVAFALGAVVFHSITADTVGPAVQTEAAKPMSPLQMLRRDHAAAAQQAE
jgi:hypothetical protein